MPDARLEPPPLPLDARQRRRGRRLALVSHPAGMVHHNVYTEHLPTLVLVGLGAGETLVGLQRAFEPVAQLLQLPTLRAVGRLRKRSILIAGQAAAVGAGLPLATYGALAAGGGGAALGVALASLAATSACLVVSNTVWFPLLRGYVEPGRTGAFFGLLRSGWHLSLIVYFLGAQRWLEAHPGSFGPLFAVASAAGLLRIGLLLGLPEAAARPGARIRARDAVALLRRETRLRRYLAGMILFGCARRAATPFAIVWMRRALGLSDAEVVATTVGFFAGGFASLYAWGRAVDRLGPLRVFRATAWGAAALLAALAAWGGGSLLSMTGFFFALAVLAAGFGVADTHVLFGIAPEQEPAPTLVIADVTTSLAYGVAPILAGLALDAAIGAGAEAVAAYRVLFAAAALACGFAPLSLRGFRP
jgi:predicted MFS family arabinose efflux permease